MTCTYMYVGQPVGYYWIAYACTYVCHVYTACMNITPEITMKHFLFESITVDNILLLNIIIHTLNRCYKSYL